MTYLSWLQRATAKQLLVCAAASGLLAVSLLAGDIVVERFHAGDFLAGISSLGALVYAALAYRAWQRA